MGVIDGDRRNPFCGIAFQYQIAALSKAELDTTATRNREQAETKLAATRDEVVTDLNAARDGSESIRALPNAFRMNPSE
jgi:hypothetical protein